MCTAQFDKSLLYGFMFIIGKTTEQEFRYPPKMFILTLMNWEEITVYVVTYLFIWEIYKYKMLPK